MPAIDIVDSTWLPARPATAAAAVADPPNWRRWWPGLELRVDEWRGEKGVRWVVRSVRPRRGIATAGLAGTAEVWLEPMFEGVVAHFFLRLDPAPGTGVPPRVRERLTHLYRLQTKRSFWALADRLDPGRAVRFTSTSHPSGS